MNHFNGSHCIFQEVQGIFQDFFQGTKHKIPHNPSGHEGKVNNAVLTVPALGGAGIAYDAFNSQNNGFDFGDVALIVFIEHENRVTLGVIVATTNSLGYNSDIRTRFLMTCKNLCKVDVADGIAIRKNQNVLCASRNEVGNAEKRLKTGVV